MRHPGEFSGGHGAPAGACVLAPIGRLGYWPTQHVVRTERMWGAADTGATAYRRRRGPCRLLGDEQRCACVPSADAIDPKLSFGRRRVASVKAATLIIRCSSSNPRQQRRWHHYAKLSLATCRKESFTGVAAAKRTRARTELGSPQRLCFREFFFKLVDAFLQGRQS